MMLGVNEVFMAEVLYGFVKDVNMHLEIKDNNI